MDDDAGEVVEAGGVMPEKCYVVVEGLYNVKLIGNMPR